jgi:hypothetical protein
MTTYPEIAEALTDENLATMVALYNRPCRDGEGNLREITEAEAECQTALRAEARRRGLI